MLSFAHFFRSKSSFLNQHFTRKPTFLLFLGFIAFVVTLTVSLPLESLPARGAEPVAPARLDLCALQKDFLFFTQEKTGGKQADELSCEELLADKYPAVFESQFETGKNQVFTTELKAIVAGFPIERMAEAIATYERDIAGLIVGIGKKESNWGKRTPKLLGEECYNYWGYRAPGDRGLTPDGYGCFATPEAAVKKIGDRLVTLRELRKSSTPARMVVWKCGNSCATHSSESVVKWVSDVNVYYRAIAKTP